MGNWKNSRMFSITSDGNDIILSDPCEVIIDENRIVVSYFQEGQAISYIGPNKGNDHFFLECHELNGSGSLHRFPDSPILVGSWVESGDDGFWKIELK